MRGTPHGAVDRVFNRGIIPAYAGNTRVPCIRPAGVGDHPRVCGEHVGCQRAWSYDPGSSPRMRGTLKGATCYEMCKGIIPAYAGNTKLLLRRHHWRRDHPRVCGEHTKRLA